MTRIVVVTGGRAYADRGRLEEVLDAAHAQGPFRLVVGDAEGADALAVRWAARRGVPFNQFVADWHAHGKAAGPIRNRRMLTVQRPDLVIAFPGSRGTRDCVRQATQLGIPVRHIT